MTIRKLLYPLIIVVVLGGCGSPFAQEVVPPSNAKVIASPFDLPEVLKNDLQGVKVNWDGYLTLLDSGETMYWPPEQPDSVNPFFSRFSKDGRYYIYVDSPLVVGSDGLPTSGDESIGMTDFETGEVTKIISKAQLFPNANSFASSIITPDGKSIYFVAFGEDWADLVKVDLASRKLERMNVDILLSNWGNPDISSKEQFVVICADSSSQEPMSELCLLDEHGKFIRYLTNEDYPWPGYGLFTPSGDWVVYESRNKLYKVRIDGSERQEVAPCAISGPITITNEYAVTECIISKEPRCSALFIASLDGQDFRRIGYIEPYCKQEK